MDDWQIVWPSADELRPYMGKWAAILDAEVVRSEDSLKELVMWICTLKEDFPGSILRVPKAGEHDER